MIPMVLMFSAYEFKTAITVDVCDICAELCTLVGAGTLE